MGLVDGRTLAELGAAAGPDTESGTPVGSEGADWEIDQWLGLLGDAETDSMARDQGLVDVGDLRRVLVLRDAGALAPAAADDRPASGRWAVVADSLTDNVVPAATEWEQEVYLTVAPLLRAEWNAGLEMCPAAAAGQTLAALRRISRRPPTRLLRIVTPSLVVSMHRANAADEPPVDMADYLRRSRETASPPLDEFPSLQRLVRTRCRLWVRHCVEVASAAVSDHVAVRRVVGRDPGRVVGAEMGLGDDHGGGRAVCRVLFEHGSAVYRPRVTEVTGPLMKFADEVGRTDGHGAPVRLPRTVVVDSHEWAAWVTRTRTDDVDRDGYSRALGRAAAFLWLTGATDVHSENLVAAAEGPVLVDAETALTPGRRPPPGRVTGSGFEALAGSPLSVLVLPVTVDGPQGRYDPSVLGDTDDQPAGLAQVWQDPGGPGMHSVLGQVVRRHTNTALPSDSSGTWSWDASSVLEGFTSLLHALCGRADELLAPDGAWDHLTRARCRVLLRPTSLYSELLGASLHPTLMGNMSHRQRFFDQLRVVSTVDPAMRPAVRAEIEATLAGDFPFFLSPGDSRALCGPDREVLASEFFGRSAREVSAERIRGLDVDAVARARWVASAAMTTSRYNREGHFPADICCARPERVGKDVLGHAGEVLSRRLLALAHPARVGAPTWLDVRSDAGSGWRVTSSDDGLYAGRLGIAVALAAWAAVSGDGRSRAAAGDVYDDLVRTGGWLEQDLVGAFQGIAADLRGLVALGRLLGRNDVGEVLAFGARALLAAHPGDAGGPRPTDVMAGAAGAVLVLADVERHGSAGERTRGDARDARDALAAWSDSLSLTATSSPDEPGRAWPSDAQHGRPLVGFSHGTGGIALALAVAGDRLGSSSNRVLIEDALRWERSHRTPAGGWEDRRPFAESPASATWCNGSLGTGIGRAAMAAVLGPRADLVEDMRRAYTHAVDSRLVLGAGQSLCHGDLGAVEMCQLIGGFADVEDESGSLLGMVAAAVVRDEGVTRAGYGGLVDLPGLMNGTAGVLYEVTRGIEPLMGGGVLRGGLF